MSVDLETAAKIAQIVIAIAASITTASLILLWKQLKQTQEQTRKEHERVSRKKSLFWKRDAVPGSWIYGMIFQ
ncbi:MAG: hypothetical protein HQL52_14005, partial [Magnetococcales bacterium]|nr:hypothetical protein [Magnetococcales bacterium]